MEQCALQPKEDQPHPGLSQQKSNLLCMPSDYSPPCSTLPPHLEGCAHLGAPHYKKDFDILGDGHQDDQMTSMWHMMKG